MTCSRIFDSFTVYAVPPSLIMVVVVPSRPQPVVKGEKTLLCPLDPALALSCFPTFSSSPYGKGLPFPCGEPRSNVLQHVGPDQI